MPLEIEEESSRDTPTDKTPPLEGSRAKPKEGTIMTLLT
jgi:hypothetical protein